MPYIDKSKIRVVWVDLDDTLIDFKANSRSALTRLWTDHGFQRLWPNPQEWIEAYEHHNVPLWVDYSVGNISAATLRAERFRRPLSDAGMSDEEALSIFPDLDRDYLDNLAMEKQLVPGATELLHHLRQQGYTIGIMSNGFADVQYRKIERAGLSPLIDLTVLSDDIGVTKPDIRLFQYAQGLTEWPDKPDAHLMIGDNPATDIGGALAAGWSAIWFNPFSRPEIPEGALNISSLDELHSII